MALEPNPTPVDESAGSDMVTLSLPRDVYEGLVQMLGQFMPLLQEAAAQEQAAVAGAPGKGINPADVKSLQDEMMASDAAKRGM